MHSDDKTIQPLETRMSGTAEPAAAPPDPGDEDEGPLHALMDAAGDQVLSVARPIGRRVGRVAAGAQRRFRESAGQRVRRVRRMGHEPLPNLYGVRPEAHLAFPRTLGLRTIAVSAIHGTAVEGPTQRGGDFLPLRQLRGMDWQARWTRIRSALDRLVDLPPIEVVKYGDEYWVTDGHNRIAAALYNGQGAIDAVVTELRVPGASSEPTGPIGPYLQGSLDLRAAGEGRLTRTAVRPEDWEVLPDAIAGGRGEADPDDEQPAGSPPDRRAHHHGQRDHGQRADADPDDVAGQGEVALPEAVAGPGDATGPRDATGPGDVGGT